MSTQHKKISGSRIIYLDFMLIMIGLGCSDSLRGIFAPVFQEHFSLSAVGLSAIITASYGGNLVFLLLGSRLADRFGKKRVFAAVLGLWLGALLLYVATDRYLWLLVGMFFAMGASTLLNTMMNLLAPVLFAAPGLAINTLFFVQGIGTSGSQNIIGRYADSFAFWKVVNMGLFFLGIAGLVLFLFLEIPERKDCVTQEKQEKKACAQRLWKMPAFRFLLFCFGFYFVAEHGILNWLIVYCTRGLSMDGVGASLYLSLFFGGMTLGRLVMAPFVQKLGALKSIRLFGSIGGALYVLAVTAGGWRMILFGPAGLFLAILYPTLVLCVQSFFPEEVVTTATGTIISAATVFDIAFNSVFGALCETAGYRISFMILPVSMILFCVLFRIFLARVKPIS